MNNKVEVVIILFKIRRLILWNERVFNGQKMDEYHRRNKHQDQLGNWHEMHRWICYRERQRNWISNKVKREFALTFNRNEKIFVHLGPTPTFLASRRLSVKKFPSQPASIPGKPLPIYRVPRMPTEKEIADVLPRSFFTYEVFLHSRSPLLINYCVNFVMVHVLVNMCDVVCVLKHFIRNVCMNVVMWMIRPSHYHVLQDRIGVVQNV